MSPHTGPLARTGESMHGAEEKRPILVTGGAGFIGSNLVRMLVIEKGVPVVTLDKLTYAGHRESLCDLVGHPGHRFVLGDIGDEQLVGTLLASHRPRAVMHLAAETHVDRSILDPEAFVRTNCVGTVTLLEQTRRHLQALPAEERESFRFLVVSTDEVYGDSEGRDAARESSAYRPSSPYAASKAAADHFARAYHRTFGVPVLTSHSSNNYGPFQHPEKLIPRTIRCLLRWEPIPVFGQGRNQRDWIHVSDHCEALWTILNDGAPPAAYNIGTGEIRRNIDVVSAICGHLDRLWPPSSRLDGTVDSYRQLIAFVADRPGHDGCYALDTSLITRELGWRARVRFEDGLESTIRWYLEHRDWLERAAGSDAGPVAGSDAGRDDLDPEAAQ